jgi:uncharacterized protein YdaU (DUF1376 family)
MHYYQFNIGDYASHTRHLSLLEDLAYRRLLDSYYLHEKPISDDCSAVARQIGMREHADIVEMVLKEFFELTDDGYVNCRADKEIQSYRGKIEQASRAGKASAERRSNARSTDVQPNIKQEPVTNNHKPITKEKTATRGTRLPADWKPNDELVAWSKAERSDLDLRKVFAEFKDYWVSVPGVKGVKLDWDATWRNWVRSQKAEKQTFAQVAADVARSTVPASPKQSEALKQIEDDLKKAVPMPAHIRDQINSVIKRV